MSAHAVWKVNVIQLNFRRQGVPVPPRITYSTQSDDQLLGSFAVDDTVPGQTLVKNYRSINDIHADIEQGTVSFISLYQLLNRILSHNEVTSRASHEGLLFTKKKK